MLGMEFSKLEYRQTQQYEDIPIYVLIPAFIISELKAAFQIGFLLFIGTFLMAWNSTEDYRDNLRQNSYFPSVKSSLI